MAFDQLTRNRLARFVSDARRLISEEFTFQFQSIYGISPTGHLTPVDQLGHLDETQRTTAAVLRERIRYLIHSHPGETKREAAAVDRLAREHAFTVLNRLAAIRMAEKRGLIVESVGKGYQSKGFQVYSQVAGSGLGETFHRFRRYLFCLFDELAVDLGVLFDRRSPSAILFPREQALLDLLALLNAPDLDALWAEDETIGWIYQYYNDPEERKQMREASAAPRNSRELAVRNQFFTPRYVVEFLTDNTLGRLWYEMTRGETTLRESCRYLVRRPTEIFLGDPKWAYERIFGKPEDGDYGKVPAAYRADFSSLPDDGPDSRWISVAIPPSEFQKITGEPYQPFEDDRLGRLIDDIIAGTENPDAETLLQVWAAISQFTLNDGGGAYSIKPWKRLWSHFCKVAQQPRAKSSSQEDLLRQPVIIPHRSLKDPREIRLLDPACGSMHFGLYAFDLFTGLYDEAWEIAHGSNNVAKSAETFAPFVTFAASFPEKAAFLREVPRLIVEHNIHGIDIDPRAVQIAGLSLWLRAQRSWHEAGVKPADRPRITRSNLVCAEPMPGDKELLREFVEQQFPAGERPAFSFLLEKVFDRMTLAGEAGSLLRIEEEIRSAIAEACALAEKQSAPRQAPLFPGDERPEQAEFNLRGLTDEQFWHAAEQRIYDALEAYAEQAENGGGFQRRLFADDAAHGFAFIDLCRKRYDVVVMNPPFGAASKNWKAVYEVQYPSAKADLYAGFVERAAVILSERGFIGAITARTAFFLTSFQTWRETTLRERARPLVFADLGNGVLDSALVETAAYCLSSAATGSTTFFRLLHDDDKGAGLSCAVSGLFDASSSTQAFHADIESFATLPGMPLAYWISAEIRRVFAETMPLGAHQLNLVRGGTTMDDFRFLRTWWETASDSAARDRSSTLAGKRWVPFAKGGEFSRYFCDWELTIEWGNDGAVLKEAISEYRGSHGWGYQWTAAINGHSFYFLPGITFPRRTTSGLNVRVLPSGCIFADQSPTIFAETKTLFTLLGLMNSPAFMDLVAVQLGAADTAARSYQVGLMNTTPVPELGGDDGAKLAELACECVALKREINTADERSHLFRLPALARFTGSLGENTSAWIAHTASIDRKVYKRQKEIDDLTLRLYRLTAHDLGAVEGYLVDDDTSESASEAADVRGEIALSGQQSVGLTETFLSYLVGCTFGRWDIRYAMGERPSPDLPDPFAPLPICPPGMLQGNDGLPLSPEAGRRLQAEGHYPLDVAWVGILVDDPEHPLDLELHVRAALSALWGDRADELEHEACTLLGVPTLREWFRRPAGFFADHLKRYSKSRRQAPIYWPLSTASGSYTLWLYYHRLTDQTLHTAIADFLDPKIKALDRDIATLREAPGGGGSRLGELLDFQDELQALRAELERVIKLPWRPDLNDGVLVTASPLWKLFRLGKWQKDLKGCWEALEQGDYDWAHLAYTIWPDRVRDKCRTDRSLAIAHSLEELCEIAPPVARAPRRTRPDAAAKEREARRAALLEELTEALANIFLGEKMPLDVVNARTGEIIIPANRKITKILLRKLAYAYDQIDIDPSPYRNKVREIIAQFEPRLIEFTDTGAIPAGSRELFP